MLLFGKQWRNESVFETKVKLFLFLKRFFVFFFKKMSETKIFLGGTHGPPYSCCLLQSSRSPLIRCKEYKHALDKYQRRNYFLL